ncbi:MAG: hypothetical protein HQK76_16080 [Desulfobacterales bacterium]|nr:hypothetical protein [Desulfobacterales bacterium]
MFKNISMQQIKSDICTTIAAKHVYFVFDACFAGLMLDTRAAMSKPNRDISYLKALTKEQVRQVLTAGDKGQTVLDGGYKGHSVFTGRFIEALERQRLLKESELKQAEIKLKQKEEALKLQKEAEIEAQKNAKKQKAQEKENEMRLAMLREKAEKMKQELGGDLTGGATIDSACAELKQIKEQHDKIEREFSSELSRQESELSKFYDAKIFKIMRIPSWDKEFETKSDYDARVAAAEREAAPENKKRLRRKAAANFHYDAMRYIV